MHPYFRKVNPDCTCFRVLFIYLDNENVFDAIFGIFLKSANKERTPIYCNTPIKSYVLLTIEAYNTYHMGIIGFPTAFEHDTTKSSLWGQTLFEGPFKDFYDFTRY